MKPGENRDVLNEIRARIGFNFSAQYQQSPVPLKGEIVRWEWFKFYDDAPVRQRRDQIVQSWDTASKAEEIKDYSVCTTWLVKGNEYYLLDLTSEQ
jgi:phage terminase large subunit-like protein